MAALGRLGSGGYGIVRYGVFSAAPPYTAPVITIPISRLGPCGYGVRRIGTMVAAPLYVDEGGDFNYLLYARSKLRR